VEALSQLIRTRLPRWSALRSLSRTHCMIEVHSGICSTSARTAHTHVEGDGRRNLRTGNFPPHSITNHLPAPGKRLRRTSDRLTDAVHRSAPIGPM
jgi:hypothetical protein